MWWAIVIISGFLEGLGLHYKKPVLSVILSLSHFLFTLVLLACSFEMLYFWEISIHYIFFPSTVSHPNRGRSTPCQTLGWHLCSYEQWIVLYSEKQFIASGKRLLTYILSEASGAFLFQIKCAIEFLWPHGKCSCSSTLTFQYNLI